MLKRILVLGLAALLAAPAALAEACSGTVAAASTLRVEAEAGAAVAEILTVPGARVSAGDALATLDATRVFATQDGVVARLQAEAGDRADGTVLEISPTSRYKIYCTVDEAYASAETMLVHSGEALYIRCTADGTHRATGIVTQIDSGEFQLLTTGGELYVGETVYLYRDADFSARTRVGIGTVVANNAEAYAASGVLRQICVEAGETVERGELLYSYAETDAAELISPVDGIVLETAASDSAEDGGAAFTIVPLDALCVELQLAEDVAAGLQTGDAVAVCYASDPEETLVPGAVSQIFALEEDGLYTVRIQPETCPEQLGLSATVYLPD